MCLSFSASISPAFTMQSLAGTLVLSFCFWASLVQSQENTWEDPIRFATKAKDQCSMMITEYGDLSNLRIYCHSQDRSYWCDYQGRPQVCRNYNNNPRHFFTQIMWGLRKLRNACQGESVLKAFMCKKASDEAQMVFASSSSTYDAPRDERVQPAWTSPDIIEGKPRNGRPDSPKSDQSRPNGSRQRTKPRTKPTRPMKVVKSRTPPPPTTAPTTPGPTGSAKRLARQHCWPSLQSACAFVIGWFTY